MKLAKFALELGEKSIAQIFSPQVSNKISRISASFELWYMYVAQIFLELFKNKIRPVSKNYPVYKMTFHLNLASVKTGRDAWFWLQVRSDWIEMGPFQINFHYIYSSAVPNLTIRRDN